MSVKHLKVVAVLALAASAALSANSAHAASASAEMTLQVDDVLSPGQRLTANAYRESPNGLYRLVQLGDGNLVVLDRAAKKALWSSQTHGHPGSATYLQLDGNLVVKSPEGRALWNSRTFGNANVRLVMQNDGNAVLYGGSKALWSSERGDFTLSAGERLPANAYRESPNGLYRLVQLGDGNLVVLDRATKKALWSSQTHGHPGSSTYLQLDGNLVVKSPEGRALWSSRTSGNTAARLVMPNDGNAVLFSNADQALWSTKTAR